MFGIEPSEYLLVAIVALVVIGPKDLPKVMRVVGQWVGKARGMARHFRSGFDEMVRQSEMEEMEKRWKAENERIMREHPSPPAEEADDAAHALGHYPTEPAPEEKHEPTHAEAVEQATDQLALPMNAPSPAGELAAAPEPKDTK